MPWSAHAQTLPMLSVYSHGLWPLDVIVPVTGQLLCECWHTYSPPETECSLLGALMYSFRVGVMLPGQMIRWTGDPVRATVGLLGQAWFHGVLLAHLLLPFHPVRLSSMQVQQQHRMLFG